LRVPAGTGLPNTSARATALALSGHGRADVNWFRKITGFDKKNYASTQAS
jgi:hypothetical protein